MAKNYSIAEAVQVIAENEDAVSILDLGKRYPLLTNKITRVAMMAGDDFVDLMSYFPEYLSANKVNSAIKKALEAEEGEAEEEDEAEAEDAEEEEEAQEEKPAKKRGRKTKKQEESSAEEDGDFDYASMNNAKMYKLLGELGKRKDCKEKFGDLSHDSMLKYLTKYGPKSGGGTTDEAEEEDEEAVDQYEGMSAVELFKLCKKRKIKAEQKKTAKYYADLLRKADAAEAEEAEEEGEEWDDEEEEAPKKPAKKEKKSAKKAKKEEPEEDEDDDDDWDI